MTQTKIKKDDGTWQLISGVTGPAGPPGPTGPKGDPGSSGLSTIHLPTTGAWYGSPTFGTATVLTVVAGTMYASPVTIAKQITVVRMGCNVSTGGAGGTLIYLGFYSSLPDETPGSLLVASDSMAGSGTAGSREGLVSGNGILLPGNYWLTLLTQGGTPQVSATAQSNLVNMLGWVSITGSAYSCLTATTGAGPLPATFPTSWAVSSNPVPRAGYKLT